MLLLFCFFTETKSACQTDPQRSCGSVNQPLNFLSSSSQALISCPVSCILSPLFILPTTALLLSLIFPLSLCAHHIFLSCSLPLSLWGNISKLKIHNHSLKTVSWPSAVCSLSKQPFRRETSGKKRKIMSQAA